MFKVCAYSHVTIKQNAVVDYKIEVRFISILIFLKQLILHRNERSFLLSPLYKHFKGMFVYTRNEKSTLKKSNAKAVFFQNKPV